MRLRRHFFISTDLDDLESMERELEREGFVTPQIHVLTLDDSSADHHHSIHAVTSLMRTDVVRSALIGAAVGVVAAVLVLLVAYLAGWTQTQAGWTPFVFLAIVLLGFFPWEGGLRGIESPNAHFQRFEKALSAGKHVFFVDLEPGQEGILHRVVVRHPTVEPAGTGAGAPHWLVSCHHRVKRFFTETFP